MSQEKLAPGEGRIDQSHGLSGEGTKVEDGVIKGVFLCGLRSKNGYEIPHGVLAEAAPSYDGALVFLDHQYPNLADRKVGELGGVIHNPRMESNGLYGDMDTNDMPAGRTLLGLARKAVKNVGMSHVVRYEMDHSNKRVKRIMNVVQVDLVIRPATTNSIFEQEKPQMEPTAESLLNEKATRLEKQLADADKARIDAESRATQFQGQVTTLTAENTQLKGEVTKLTSAVNDFTTKESVAKRRIAVGSELEAAFKDVKVQLTDKDLFSESFLAELLAIESAEQRAVRIADHKKTITKCLGTSAEGTQATERKDGDGKKTWNSAESLKNPALFN